MPLDDTEVIKLANSSGFPLQIAIQQAVEDAKMRWSVKYVEHGWVHPSDRDKGFIDLVIRSTDGRCTFVVECKRQRDVPWTFMHYSGTAEARRHSKPWVIFAEGQHVKIAGWENIAVDPASPEATFCVLRGQTDRNGMLERVGAELIQSVEALTYAEMNLRPMDNPSTRLFYPIIVTTADLKFAVFDPATVSLETGDLSKAEVVDVKFLRFRKQLSSRSVQLTADAGHDPSYAMESSIFVVRADYFIDFLKQFETPVDEVVLARLQA